MAFLACMTTLTQNSGHDRGVGLADHHFLHYTTTLGTILHIIYIRYATTHQIHHDH